MKRTPISRKTRLQPVSAKRRALGPERMATRNAVFERAAGICEARTERCTYFGCDVHEIKTRARGGSITDERNCLLLCRECHSKITVEISFATEHGFIVSTYATAEDLIDAEERRRAYRRGRG